ncbi:hypothetical protein Rctr197k_143 [Virus Rctr197k]|nr:hypothetical protein Rctr197k_143 [Virus Rctr197k]
MKNLTKKQTLKTLRETRELSTTMLKVLGIPFESFLALCELPPDRVRRLIDKLIARLEREIAADALARKAEKALADGDLDKAFDLGMKAANVQDGLE